MPGRTENEAVKNFLAPLRDALAVLHASGVLVVTPKGTFRKGVTYLWALNEERGMRLGNVGTLYATMKFEIVDSDPEWDEGGPFRVSTRAYNYKFTDAAGQDRWRMHWHPEPPNTMIVPHLHLPPDYAHRRCPRMTFEAAIEWCLPFHPPLNCSEEEALAELLLARAPHLMHRRWVDHPDEPRPQRRPSTPPAPVDA